VRHLHWFIARHYLGENASPHQIETSFYGDLKKYGEWMLAPIAAGIAPTEHAPARTSPRALRGIDNPSALLSGGRVPSPDRMVAESALLPAIAAGLPVLDLRLPAPLCTGDEVRIRAYAGRIAASVGLKPDDDLKLFGPDDEVLPNLAPVMLAMSAVELGTLRAGPELVAGAVTRLAGEGP